MTEMPHVVVLGAGFAGISATAELAKSGFRVTLVDHHPYNTFQPLLYQVATGGLNPGDVTYSLRFFAARRRGVRFRRTMVTGIDHDHRALLCADDLRIPYDYLIVATGVTTNHFGIPGAAEYSMSMYTRAEALRVRDTIFGGLETIASHTDPATGPGRFTVVVVGGGATGVEMAGSLAELRDNAVRTVYPELDPAMVHVVLVEMGDAVLAPFDDSLRQYALRELIKRGVDVRLKTAITQVHADRVDFADDTSMAVDLVIWAAGVAGDKGLADWGLPLGKGGRIEVEPDLRVIGQERIFAAGDIALIVRDPQAQLAQPAIQEGKHAARQIARLHRHELPEPFAYHDKGTMATIGRADAVMQLPIGVKGRGLIAWLVWIAVHIVSLLGNRNRVQTMINLISRYGGPKRSGAIVGDVLDTPARKKAIEGS
ncbi:NAD(P)/FAD-dependent oxidoreductase [Microlunatus sp. GCM10028923]|uniref:NAD(P)/FAD-dependent oxidoreductase n=1 Tax=Microlunatus sp. GCM10028923 TaxID=3273400 RepID=UPI0036076476